MGEFRMPSLGADMDEGTIVEWRVGAGDEVHRGDIVAVVETEKSDLDVEVFESGIIEQILVPAGEKVAVGTVLAVLAPVGATVSTPPRPTPVAPPAEPTPVVEVAAATPTLEPDATEHSEHSEPAAVLSPVIRHLADRLHVDLAEVHPERGDGRIHRDDVERAATPVSAPAPAPAARAPRRSRPARPAHPVARPDGSGRRSSPRARHLAAELGVDLSTVRGTGPDGAIVGSDVLAVGATAPPTASAATPVAAPAPAEAPPPTVTSVSRAPAGRKAARPDRIAARRRAIGELMTRSWQTIPHYHLRHRISMEAALDWLDDHNAVAPVEERILPAALLLRAVAVAASRTPGINGLWADDHFEPSEAVHLGVAVALRDGGLLTPCIHDADRMTPAELMASLRDLVNRARTGHLKASDTTGATITVTNLGDVGVDEIVGVIFPPQVAIVGFGVVKDEPWAVGGMLGVHRVVHATVAADHRANDGRVGGAFLATVDRLLQEPDQL